MAVILGAVAIAILVAGLVIERAFHRPDRFVEQLGEADILNRMWFPLQEELTDVVRMGGRVTEAPSAWTAAPGLSKRETPRTFFTGMQRYVRQRELVASLATSDLSTEESRQQLEAGQQRLAVHGPGAAQGGQQGHRSDTGRIGRQKDPKRATETVRTNGHRPPRPRQAPASSAETRQSTPVSRSAQAQTATSARTIRERPVPARPAPAPMRIADATRTPDRTSATPIRWEPEPPKAPSVPRPPSGPAPTPLSIKDTHMPAEPDIAAPAPREPEPTPVPSVPPAPSPVTDIRTGARRCRARSQCTGACRDAKRGATRRGVGVRGPVRSQSDEL